MSTTPTTPEKISVSLLQTGIEAFDGIAPGVGNAIKFLGEQKQDKSRFLYSDKLLIDIAEILPDGLTLEAIDKDLQVFTQRLALRSTRRLPISEMVAALRTADKAQIERLSQEFAMHGMSERHFLAVGAGFLPLLALCAVVLLVDACAGSRKGCGWDEPQPSPK